MTELEEGSQTGHVSYDWFSGQIMTDNDLLQLRQIERKMSRRY